MTELEQYYTAQEAALVLSRNSGKEIKPMYLRILVRYGKLTPLRINTRTFLYPRVEVDAYKVEDRGKKSARAAKKKAHAVVS